MADLRTEYLGLDLRHPIVASASPLSRTLDGVRRLEDAGAAAVVLFSLFEEQIVQENQAFEHLTTVSAESFPEALGYFPAAAEYEVGPDAYLELVLRAREAVDIPVIASLNGTTGDGWTGYARLLHQAGAHALELNIFYVAVDAALTGREVEQRYVDVVRAVRAAVPIPVAVKLGPFFSAFGEMARRIVEAGADGLVLFNRFYQPDFDLERREVVPDLDLSSTAEIRLPLLWLAVLHGRLKAALAATTGVQSASEVVKYIMAGADVVMTTSAQLPPPPLLRHGAGHIDTLVTGLDAWLDAHGYDDVARLRGCMSQRNVADPSAFERANYIRILQGWRHPYGA
jgi:dihydroorotate dehydrogenase (fumarate)